MNNTATKSLFRACLLGLAFVCAGCEDEEPTQPEGNKNAWTFKKLSGDNQSVRVLDTLTNRMVVELKDGLKNPIENVQIRFEVMDGNGMVVSKPVATVTPNEVVMPTDWQGLAAATYRCFDTGAAVIEVKVVSRPELLVHFSTTGVQP